MAFFRNTLVIGAMLAWAGIVIGWILQEAGSHLAIRRERKEAIALALTDLWDIQYTLAGLNLLLAKLESLHEIPPQAMAQLWVAIEQFILPDSEELHNRYSQSVTTLRIPLDKGGIRNEPWAEKHCPWESLCNYNRFQAG